MAFPRGVPTTFGTLVTFKGGIASTTLSPTTPAVPASGVALTNPYGYDCMVYIDANSAGGLSVALGGVTVMSAPASGDGSFVLKGGQKITLTYSQAPTWVWRAL